MKNFYQQSIEQVFADVDSDENGLTSIEASERLKTNGENVLEQKKKKSPFTIFLSQFKNMMILLLILVGIVSLVYSIVTNESLLESIVVFGCVLINSLMGFFQELKSENAIDALQDLTVSKIQVKRDGAWVELDTNELVVGDVVLLDAGDKVPADCRIFKCINGKVDESILTGESLAVDKSVDPISKVCLLQDRVNMVYSGTSVVNGKIEAVIVGTGMNTEIGAIAGGLNKKDDTLTPLQVKVKKVSSFITVIACVLIALTLCYGLIKNLDAISIIMLCISMVLASVPEVLPISITATLTIGVNQMSKRKTIVKQMAAIETLGATQIVCSDKTGTITTNQMTLVEIFTNGKTYLDVKSNKDELHQLNNVLALCNDTENDVKAKGEYIGDPVEIAMSKYLYNKNIDINTIRKKHKRVNEIPFDSTRKMMSTINEYYGKLRMFTKGSLGAIINKSTKYLKNGKEYKMSKLVKNKFLSKERSMSRKAYKVLALAYKNVSKKKNYTEDDEDDLVLVGIIGMIDPPKDGVKEAVQKCIEAKMRPIMITGDSLATAMAVAKDVGIATTNKQGVEGSAINGLTDDELVSFVKKYTVFARVTPEHKVRIVRAFQAAGKVVAMTGDGVNDAPALKLAHVGIGMGKAGTDVTKSVADIILMDDSFATIITAVEEGRRIYNNVLRTILYNLSSNFAEIFLILFGMIIGQDIITALHILYIDIVADTIPSIALAFEKDSKDSMKKEPNGLNKPIFNGFMVSSIVVSAIIEVAVSLVVFFVAKHYFGYEIAQTLSLLSVVLSEFTFTYNCKELRTFAFKKGLFNNSFMNISILILLLVQIIVFFTPVGVLFGLSTITVMQFLAVVGINIIGFLLIELVKPVLSKCFKE